MVFYFVKHNKIKKKKRREYNVWLLIIIEAPPKKLSKIRTWIVHTKKNPPDSTKHNKIILNFSFSTLDPTTIVSHVALI